MPAFSLTIELNEEQQVSLATQLMSGGSGVIANQPPLVPPVPTAAWEPAPPSERFGPEAPAVWGSAEYPKVVAFEDWNSPGFKINVLVKAPINKLWRTSSIGRIFGRPANSYSLDTANGDTANPPLPLRSPRGMPLTYHFNSAGKPIGTATILWGAGSFNNDEEVAHAMVAAEMEANRPIDPEWAALDAAYAARAANNRGSVTTPPVASPPASPAVVVGSE